MFFLQRILRIPLESTASLHTLQAGYGQDSQHPVLNENSSEVRQHGLNTENTLLLPQGILLFMDFSWHVFVACSCSVLRSHRRQLAGFFL